MDKLKKNTGTLAAIVIFILFMVLYNLFFKSEIIAIPSEFPASSIGDDLIKLHEELKAVTLDRNLFSFPGFLMLIDFSTAISPQPIGRSNPFDIIGRD